jgi:excisionase family DNA binding protein
MHTPVWLSAILGNVLSDQGATPYLTTEAVAERLLCSPATVRRWRHRGEGPPAIRLGGLVRYRIADLEQWEADCARS